MPCFIWISNIANSFFLDFFPQVLYYCGTQVTYWHFLLPVSRKIVIFGGKSFMGKNNMTLKDSTSIAAYIPNELYQELYNYRFKHQYGSFSKLIAECIQRGFEIVKRENEDPGYVRKRGNND